MNDDGSSLKKLVLQLTQKVSDFIDASSTDRVVLKANLDIKVARLEVEVMALEKLMDERMKSSGIAIDKATGVLNQRLEVMNEFRTQINSERLTYMTKDDFELKHEAIRTEFDLKIDQLRADIAGLKKELHDSLQPLQQNQSYDKGRNTTLAAIIAIVVFVVITIIGHLI